MVTKWFQVGSRMASSWQADQVDKVDLILIPKMAPGRPQDSPKMASRSPPDCPKMAPILSHNMAKYDPKSVVSLRGPPNDDHQVATMAQDGSKTAQDGTKMAPRWPQDDPTMTPR